MKDETAYKLINVGIKHLVKNSLEKQMQISAKHLTKLSGDKEKEKNPLIAQADLIKELHMSKTTLWRHRLDGMPYKKLGRKIFYDLNKVVKWMEGSKLW